MTVLLKGIPFNKQPTQTTVYPQLKVNQSLNTPNSESLPRPEVHSFEDSRINSGSKTSGTGTALHPQTYGELPRGSTMSGLIMFTTLEIKTKKCLNTNLNEF